MGGCNKTTNFFDLASKVSAVMTAAAIVLSTAATTVLFPAAVVFSLAAGDWRDKFNRIISNPLAWAFLLFYAMFLVGVFYTAAPWGDVLLVLRKYAKFVLAIFFIPLFAEERWRNYAINAFLLAVVVMSLLSIFRDLGWLTYWFKFDVTKIVKNTIDCSFLTAVAAYLVLLRIVSDSRYRWLWIILFLFFAYIVMFRSIGRTGMIVFIVLMNLFLVKKLRFKGVFLGAVCSLLLVGAAYTTSNVFESRVKQVVSDVNVYKHDDYTSIGLRITFLRNSINLFIANPVFGVGTGGFVHKYAAIKTTPATLTKNPHNEYIYIAVQFGVIGLAILLLFFGIPVWNGEMLPAKYRDISQGMILAIMTGCLANSWLLDTTPGHCYAYFMVLAFAAWSRTKDLCK